MDLLRLRAGRLAVDLAPHAGGSIARFAIEEKGRLPIDLLRRADPESLADGTGKGVHSGYEDAMVRAHAPIVSLSARGLWPTHDRRSGTSHRIHY